MNIDVDKVISDIKTEIDEKGYKADIPSFYDVVDIAVISRGEGFSEKEYKKVISCLSTGYVVSSQSECKEGRLKEFIKKVVRKLVSIAMKPMLEYQFDYNRNALIALEMMGEYVKESTKKINELEGKLEEANGKIDKLCAKISRYELND